MTAMKNSQLYSKKLRKLYSTAKRKYRREKMPVHEEPAEALVHGIVSELLPYKVLARVFRKINEHFVDLNDLRVSRVEEVTSVLGADSPENREVASKLSTVLGAIFEKYNAVSLTPLRQTGKRAARETLEKIEGLGRFPIDYCMLTSLRAHAIPLTPPMTEYLRKNELIEPECDEQTLESFLARQITAAQAWDFYTVLRRSAESGKPAPRAVTAERAARTASRKKKK
jgi:endonuclease III